MNISQKSSGTAQRIARQVDDGWHRSSFPSVYRQSDDARGKTQTDGNRNRPRFTVFALKYAKKGTGHLKRLHLKRLNDLRTNIQNRIEKHGNRFSCRPAFVGIVAHTIE